MTAPIIYAITGISPDPTKDPYAEYMVLAARAPIIRASDLDWVHASSKVLLRYVQDVPADFRCVPTKAEIVAIAQQRQVLGLFPPDGSPRLRFFMTDKAYFAASSLWGGISPEDFGNAAWVVARYVSEYPTYSFWAIDVDYVNGQLAVVGIHDGNSVSLGDTLPAEAFYQALMAKLTGSCCR